MEDIPMHYHDKEHSKEEQKEKTNKFYDATITCFFNSTYFFNGIIKI
jgi:hypothetical protein